MDLTFPLVLLTAYVVLIVVTGIYSSWEYAAILAIGLTLGPLLLLPKQYFNFLKIILLDMEIYKVTVFSFLLIFDACVVGYAFNAWLKVLFVAIFLMLIAYQLGLLGNVPIQISWGG